MCGPRRSDGHLLAEVAHEQDGAHEEPRGAEQVLSGSEGGAGGRQTGLVLGGKNTRGANHPGDRGGQRGDTRRERARTMVLSRFGGANSLSIISFKPMIAETRAVAVRPACLEAGDQQGGALRCRVGIATTVPGREASPGAHTLAPRPLNDFQLESIYKGD